MSVAYYSVSARLQYTPGSQLRAGEEASGVGEGMTEVGAGRVLQGLEELAVGGDHKRIRVLSEDQKESVVDDHAGLEGAHSVAYFSAPEPEVPGALTLWVSEQKVTPWTTKSRQCANVVRVSRTGDTAPYEKVRARCAKPTTA